MKRLLLLPLLLLSLFVSTSTVSAYSYGDPGKEAFAEAYKQFEEQLDAKDYALAKETLAAYDKEFKLYFPEAKAKIVSLSVKISNVACTLLKSSSRTSVKRNSYSRKPVARMMCSHLT